MDNKDTHPKRIGILTMYYLSSNYGGLLQAFALTKYLNDHGYDAKQITYDFYSDAENLTKSRTQKHFAKRLWIKRFAKIVIMKANEYLHGGVKLQVKKRNICKQFRESIPHTDKVYLANELQETLNDFDVFLVGSDQVWNPAGYHRGFFLKFVDGNQKIKMSYAASLSNELPVEGIVKYRDALKDYTIISVREKSDVKVIQKLTDKSVRWVLDPVFLLTRDQWIEQCSGLYEKIEKPYIFCYFLGDSEKQRELAAEYGKEHNLIVVTIPYMQMIYRHCDRNFGDIKLNEVSPNYFLDLIKNAEAIFTDSFHATAFSIIFGKQFVVFGRLEHPEMAERIKNITELFKCEERFCKDMNRNEYYLDKIITDDKNVEYRSEAFNELLKHSEEVLRF